MGVHLDLCGLKKKPRDRCDAFFPANEAGTGIDVSQMVGRYSVRRDCETQTLGTRAIYRI